MSKGRRYLATGLLNHVRDVNFGIHDFTEFPSVVSLQELKSGNFDRFISSALSKCQDRPTPHSG
jgi:hypothetical protein